MARAGLSSECIGSIVEIVDGWSERRITWTKLLGAVRTRLGWQYTRQGLNQYGAIKRAFQERQRGLRSGSEQFKPRTAEMQAADERIRRLEAKVTRLERENEHLNETLARWAINVANAGKTIEWLNGPLAKPDREATVHTQRRKKSTSTNAGHRKK